MEYDLQQESIEKALSRGDVETLVVLYRINPYLREPFDKGVPQLAKLNNLLAEEYTTFKDWVVRIYDPEQARLVYEEGNALSYIKEGGIAHARNTARLLIQELYTCNIKGSIAYIHAMSRIDELITVLIEVLNKLNGEYNGDINIIASLSIIDLVIRTLLLSNVSTLTLERFLAYPGALDAFRRQPYNLSHSSPIYAFRWKFFKRYITKHYPKQGVKVIEGVLNYLKDPKGLSPGEVNWDNRFLDPREDELNNKSIDYLIDNYNLTPSKIEYLQSVHI